MLCDHPKCTEINQDVLNKCSIVHFITLESNVSMANYNLASLKSLKYKPRQWFVASFMFKPNELRVIIVQYFVSGMLLRM